MVADQVIEIAGKTVNIHEIKTVIVNSRGEIVEVILLREDKMPDEELKEQITIAIDQMFKGSLYYYSQDAMDICVAQIMRAVEQTRKEDRKEGGKELMAWMNEECKEHGHLANSHLWCPDCMETKLKELGLNPHQK